MSVGIDRLKYALESMSVKQLHNETGIPTARIALAKLGIMDIPAKYQNAMFSTYKKVTYHNMRDAGMSVQEASRFRGGNVTNIRNNISLYNQMVEYSMKGALALEEYRRDVPMSAQERLAYWDSIEENVRKGYQTSHEAKEAIQYYIERAGFSFADEM